MSVRMMSGLAARVIQVLQDFLPAELDLIDTEESDGITTPDISAGDYFQWDRGTVPNYPACTIRTVSSIPAQVYRDLRGLRVDARHRLDVMFHATLAETPNPISPEQLQKLMHRYISGAMRVLCIKKASLETSADPTRFVQAVDWVGEAVYGPEQGQDEGTGIRTATLQIEVLRTEAL